MAGSPLKKSKKEKARSSSLKISAPVTSILDERPFIGKICTSKFWFHKGLVDDVSFADGFPDFSLRSNNDTRKGHQRLLEGETNKTRLRAMNYGEQNKANEDYHYLVMRCV